MKYVSPSGCPDGAPCSHAEVEAEWPKGLREFQALSRWRINSGEHPGERGPIPAQRKPPLLSFVVGWCAFLLRDYVQTQKGASMLGCYCKMLLCVS